MNFLKTLVNDVTQPNPQKDRDRNDNNSNGDDVHEGFKDTILDFVDKYVDGLAPDIAPLIEREIIEFQKFTIESLENHIKEAFESVFKGHLSVFHDDHNVEEFSKTRAVEADPNTETAVSSREISGGDPDSYGQRGVPFAFAGQALQRGFNINVNKTVEDQRNIFQSAIKSVTSFVEKESPFVSKELSQMTAFIHRINLNPAEKAREIAPELRELVGNLLTKAHEHLAHAMTSTALGQVKTYLRKHTSSKELGAGAMGSIGNFMGDIFGDRKKETQQANRSYGGANDRDAPPSQENQEGAGGIPGLLSKKLSHGLATVKQLTRGDFQATLSKIEAELFDHLPNCFKGPLSKIFGGNPFEIHRSQDQDKGHENIIEELEDKIKKIIERVQKGLRDRVLEVVSGGHRHLEARGWKMVEEAIVTKVRKVVPGVEVNLGD